MAKTLIVGEIDYSKTLGLHVDLPYYEFMPGVRKIRYI